MEYLNKDLFTQEQLEEFWSDFADIPVDEDDNIDADFNITEKYGWEKGTDRFDIWHWFDERYYGGLIVLMDGKIDDV